MAGVRARIVSLDTSNLLGIMGAKFLCVALAFVVGGAKKYLFRIIRMPDQSSPSGSPVYLISGGLDQASSAQNSGRSVGTLLIAALRRWYVFVLSLGLCLILGVILVATLPKKYTATMVVGPTSLSLSNLKGGLDALSSASAILGNLSGGPSSEFGAFITVLPSSAAARQLAEDQPLMASLFPSSWDAEAMQWSEPSGFVAALKRGVKSLLGYPRWSPPDAEDLQVLIEKNLQVRRLNQPGFYQLLFKASSPETATVFLEKLYAAADTTLKDRERTRVEARISYLERKIQQVNISEYRQTLLALLSQEEKKLLATVADLPYAADVLAHAQAERRPSSPNIVAILVGMALLGLAFGAAIVAWLENRRALGERRDSISPALPQSEA
jgi:hypothetical protein